MLATETQENYLPNGEKFLPVNESVNLEPNEWKYFILEIKEMTDNKEIIDLPKALHNAKYFAMLEEREREFDEGKVVSFTDEEWEKFVNAQDVS